MAASVDAGPIPADNDETPDMRPERSVLVVDDSRVQRKILSALLKRWGYRVLEAASGAEALEVCKADTLDLIISDWMMPGMNGLDFCQAFRQLDRGGYCYFILLTSKSEKGEVAHGLDMGADDFLIKPVNASELRSRMAAGERILAMERELTRQNRLVSSTLAELRTLYDTIDRDLIEAKKLQQSLVRERFKDFGTAQLSLVLRPSGHVGGDLVGMFPINDRHVGFFGIDVSGHGITSALMTARLAGYLSGASPEQNVALEGDEGGGFRPRKTSDAVAHLNALVLEEMDTEHYFTLILGHIDLASGTVRITQAGHPYPVVQRRDGAVDSVGPGGMPVGLLAGAQYEEFSVTLSPGDRILVPSDGITECPVAEGEMLDDDGLRDMLRVRADAAGERLLESVIWELAAKCGTQDFPDDVSAILVEFSGPG